MHRQKVLIGYEVVDGVIFAKYRKEIVEDDESITVDGIHRQTITQEAYDELKRSEFIENSLLEISAQLSIANQEKEQLQISATTVLQQRDAEISKLKKEKAELQAEKEQAKEAKK